MSKGSPKSNKSPKGSQKSNKSSKGSQKSPPESIYFPNPAWNLIKKYQIGNYIKIIGNLNISYKDNEFFFKNKDNEIVNTSENDVIIYDDGDIYAIYGKFIAEYMISDHEPIHRRHFICGSWDADLWDEDDNEYEDDDEYEDDNDDEYDDRLYYYEENFSSSIRIVRSNFLSESDGDRITRIFIQKSAWNRLSKKKRHKLLNLGSIQNIYIFNKINSIPLNFFINITQVY
jgi:hypothetical protein